MHMSKSPIPFHSIGCSFIFQSFPSVLQFSTSHCPVVKYTSSFLNGNHSASLLYCFSFLTFFPTVSISLLIFHLIFHVIHLFYQTLQHKCITNSCFKFLFRQLQHVFFFFFFHLFLLVGG